jgi:hypothetical protein
MSGNKLRIRPEWFPILQESLLKFWRGRILRGFQCERTADGLFIDNLILRQEDRFIRVFDGRCVKAFALYDRMTRKQKDVMRMLTYLAKKADRKKAQ